MKVQGPLDYMPELRFTPAGKSLCTFRIAVPERGDWQECEAWGELGDKIADLGLQRGDIMAVVGRDRVSRWTSADGEKHTRNVLSVIRYAYKKQA